MTSDNIPKADPALEAEANAWLANWRSTQSDDDVWVMCYIQAKITGGLDVKWLHLGLAELSRRSNERLRESINEFNRSSDRLGKWMLGLTVVLIVLTIPLVVDIVTKWMGRGS